MTSEDHVQKTSVDSDVATPADFPVKAKGGISGSQVEKMIKAGTVSKKGRVKSVGSSKPKRTQIVKKRKAPEPAESDQDFDFKTQAEVTTSNAAGGNDVATNAPSGKESN